MDPSLLMTLLAARNGAALPTTPDGALDPAALDPAQLMQRLGQENPALASIMQMMAAQKESSAAREPVVLEGSAADMAAEELVALGAQLECAQTEIKLLREKCDTLAAALGACALCWGHDPGCRACRGHGSPGRSLPDDDLFAEYVLPAVRLVHGSRQRSHKVAALVPVTNGGSSTESTPNRLTS